MGIIRGGSAVTRAVVSQLCDSQDVDSNARFDVNPGLNETERRALTELLTEFDGVFALNPKKPAASYNAPWRTCHRYWWGLASETEVEARVSWDRSRD